MLYCGHLNTVAYIGAWKTYNNSSVVVEKRLKHQNERQFCCVITPNLYMCETQMKVSCPHLAWYKPSLASSVGNEQTTRSCVAATGSMTLVSIVMFVLSTGRLQCSPAGDSTRLTSGAFSTVCETTSLLVSPIIKSSIACHSDNQVQDVEAVWPNCSLRLRWGPCSRSQRTAKRLETAPRSSSTNTPSSGTSNNKTSGCGGQALCTRPSSLATSDWDGYAPAGACLRWWGQIAKIRNERFQRALLHANEPRLSTLGSFAFNCCCIFYSVREHVREHSFQFWFR